MADDLDDLILRIAAGELTGDAAEAAAIEFKTDGRSIKDDLLNLADAAACFANSTGGRVIVGISDKRTGPGAFMGTRLDGDQVRLRIYELTQPPLLVDSTVRSTPHADVLVLNVPRSAQVHSVNGQIPKERVGTSCMPMSTDRISTVTAEKTGRDWSASPSNLRVGDVDSGAIEVARRMLKRSDDLKKRRLAEAPNVDLLRSLGVVTEGQHLTNAGALLFAETASAPAISYTHRRTPAGLLTANEHLTGPLLVALQQVFDLVEARIERTPISIGKGQQLHVADLPEAAVREAIINGVMHREYFSLERTAIEHSVTSMRITSPGGFVPGVSVDNVLTTSSRTRNTNLAGALRMLGLAETAGSGVDRMYAEMTRIGHAPPRFRAGATSVEVTLSGGAPNSALARFVATLPPEEAEDADTMLILLTLLTHRTIDAPAITPLLQKADASESQAVLERLSAPSMALLEPTRETARLNQPKYRLREDVLAALGSAVTYRRRTTDQVDRKIIELVAETGTINGRMVRILLDVDTVTASRMLAGLVERGILIKTSTAERGPSVTYGRGPAFPKKSRVPRARTADDGREPPVPDLLDLLNDE